MIKTNKAVASFLAMLMGWAVMMTLLLIAFVFQSTAEDFLWGVGVWGVVSSVVVLIAWLLVCLPVYCIIPTDSVAFNWYIGGPIGALIGFCVGCLFLGFMGGLLAALVGGVAGGAGHLFIAREEYCPMNI